MRKRRGRNKAAACRGAECAGQAGEDDGLGLLRTTVVELHCVHPESKSATARVGAG